MNTRPVGQPYKKKKKNFNSDPIPYTKINSGGIIDLNVKSKMLQFLGEKKKNPQKNSFMSLGWPKISQIEYKTH